MTIDRAWTRERGGLKFVMHLNMGPVHAIVRQLVDRETGQTTPIGCTDRSYKRTKRNGELAGRSERHWHVEGWPNELATLDEALMIAAELEHGDDGGLMSE